MTLRHLPPSRLVLALLLAGACLAPRAAAQQPPGRGLPQPRLLVADPAGGQAGTTFEITLTGNDIDDPQKLLFNHPGIKAETTGDPTEQVKPSQGSQPALLAAKFKVAIAADVPPGTCDVRFAGKGGVSNPRAFVVGDLSEATEKELNNDVAEAQEIPLDSTVHGAITTPTDVDFFRFAGAKEQRVVVSCLTSSIDSKLHAQLELYDKAGTLLASNRNYHDSDALLDCTLPAAGDYLVRVCSFAYLQGTDEHFYHLTVSTAPWIDLYAVLKSIGPKGAVLVELDDNPEQVPNAFYARGGGSPRYAFKVPADGDYLLQVSSREADIAADPRHLYRVRIVPERPDFRVVLMPPALNAPDACNLRRGGTGFLTAHVIRLDGFKGEIALTAEGLPEGVRWPPQTIAAGQNQGVLVLSAADDAPLGESALRVKATATIDGKLVEREARAATITWPLPQNQIAPTISRLDASLVLGVIEQGPFALTLGRTEATARPGERVTVLLKLARHWQSFKGSVQVTVLGLPGNPQQQPTLTIAADKTAGDAVVDVRSNVPPEVYTIVFRGQAQFPYSKDPAAKQKQNVTVVLPSPPLTLTVVKAKK